MPTAPVAEAVLAPDAPLDRDEASQLAAGLDKAIFALKRAAEDDLECAIGMTGETLASVDALRLRLVQFASTAGAAGSYNYAPDEMMLANRVLLCADQAHLEDGDASMRAMRAVLVGGVVVGLLIAVATS
jgi:hypothetical protein